jgi:hypothetical protein
VIVGSKSCFRYGCDTFAAGRNFVVVLEKFGSLLSHVSLQCKFQSAMEGTNRKRMGKEE